MPAFDLTALQLGDIVTSGKGAKSAPFTSNGKPVVANFEAMQIAFEPSAFQDPDATRVNVVFRPTDEVIHALTELDEFVLTTVCKDPVRWFGKVRSETQIRESYSAIEAARQVPAFVQGKGEPGGPQSGQGLGRRGGPAHAARLLEGPRGQAKPRIRLKNLYFMGTGAFGCTLECTDAQIIEERVEECPF